MFRLGGKYKRVLALHSSVYLNVNTGVHEAFQGAILDGISRHKLWAWFMCDTVCLYEKEFVIVDPFNDSEAKKFHIPQSLRSLKINYSPRCFAFHNYL